MSIHDLELVGTGRVAVAVLGLDSKTKSGIVLHMAPGNKPSHPAVQGEVVGITEGVDQVEIGDRVLFMRYAGDGNLISTPGEPEIRVLAEEDIECVLPRSNSST